MSQFGWFLTAAGVGIGFGLQEILSNLISGLILFFERPVQVGDVVSVGDIEGDVQQINIRSTVVRTRDGVSIILPNKRLITDEVVNWSHGDKRTRLQINVGVAYGSDTSLVRSVLMRIANEDARILARPAPEVDFVAFGESELQFVLYVWLATPDPTLRRRVRSDTNLRIDEHFAEHGITIPFPQRDLHIKSGPVGLVPPVVESPAPGRLTGGQGEVARPSYPAPGGRSGTAGSNGRSSTRPRIASSASSAASRTSGSRAISSRAGTALAASGPSALQPHGRGAPGAGGALGQQAGHPLDDHLAGAPMVPTARSAL